MKFTVQNILKCTPRLGTFTEIQKLPNISMETPMAMLYTRGGSIPHITNEVFKLVLKDAHVIQIPLVSTYSFQDALQHFSGTISDYVGMTQCVSCVTAQDPGDYTQPGHQTQDYVPIWTRHGKVLLNAENYMRFIELAKPDMYYLLSDSDTNIASSNKRLTKAVKNTVSYFHHCIEQHKKSEALANSFVMAAVAGGYCLKQRKICLETVTTSNVVNGYLIDGLHNNGPEVELLKYKEIKDVVEFVVENLPAEKLKAVHGCWNPLVILQLVKMGIDLFDTSYCHVATERSAALTFAFDYFSEEPYEINLRKPQFADDFQPILADCMCIACRNYTRAYIHHLVTVQELLGPLLLTIHNVHHYLKFFEKIRIGIKNDTLDELQACIKNQYNIHQEIVGKNKSVSTAKSTFDDTDDNGLQSEDTDLCGTAGTKKQKTNI